jgi:hypothetical protein
MLFSEFLKEFIEITESKSEEDCSLELDEDSHGWYNISLFAENTDYHLTLHEDYASRKEPVKKYHFLSMPTRANRKSDPYSRTYTEPVMKISLDGATLEMPFTRDVLQDPFTSFVARLILADTKITMDCRGFNDGMFPEDECHCH